MEELKVSAFEVFGNDWALLTSGKMEDFNTMTISWGGLGTLWAKPVVTVYVKPIRYTYEFMEKYDYFTVCFFDEKYKKDLSVLGSKSGRNSNKLAETDLSAYDCGDCVSFIEAKKTLICKKMYAQDLVLKDFPEGVEEKFYINEPAHRMYIAEVIKII